MTSQLPKKIRQQVKERAGYRCEYCRRPEFTASYPFHTDHVIPEQHGGDSSLGNLACACFRCNLRKLRDLTSIDPETGEITPLFNPRKQVWDEHFELNGAHLVGKTAHGRVTVNLLDMNHPDQVDMRQELIDAEKW